MADDSSRAVENYLNLGDFFKRHRDHILDKLEDSDAAAQRVEKNQDMIFFAESLPIINGLIHVGTTREELNKAIDWVKQNWGDKVDPLIVLSALTFIYVAETGAELAENPPQDKDAKMRDKEVWKRINARVKKLAHND
jgi:hypothetical protein